MERTTAAAVELLRPSQHEDERAGTDEGAGIRIDELVEILGKRQRSEISTWVVYDPCRLDHHVVRIANGRASEDELIEIRVLSRGVCGASRSIVLNEQIIVVEVDLDLISRLAQPSLTVPKNGLRDHGDHLRPKI